MTRSQVRYLLGTPMLADPFDPQRWDYIYTLQRGRDKALGSRAFHRAVRRRQGQPHREARPARAAARPEQPRSACRPAPAGAADPVPPPAPAEATPPGSKPDGTSRLIPAGAAHPAIFQRLRPWRVHARRMHAHQHLVVGDRGPGDSVDTQLVGRPVGVLHHRVHRVLVGGGAVLVARSELPVRPHRWAVAIEMRRARTTSHRARRGSPRKVTEETAYGDPWDSTSVNVSRA